METPVSGGRGQGIDASASLKQKAFAPRQRAVLENVFSVASTVLENGLSVTLNELEQQLFKLAEQARSNDQQNRCFESLREIRRGRADIAPRFVMRLEAALACVNESIEAPSFARLSRAQRDDLSLVDPTEFEESLALQEVASKSEIRNSQPLFALGQRFGVIAGAPAFEADELPIGPHRLCDCLRHAASCLDIQLEHRVLLYRVFDRVVMTHAHELYDQINDVCVHHRVLPHLQFVTPKFRRNESATAPHAHAPAATNGDPGPAAHGAGAHPAGGQHAPPHGPQAGSPEHPAPHPAAPHHAAPQPHGHVPHAPSHAQTQHGSHAPAHHAPHGAPAPPATQLPKPDPAHPLRGTGHSGAQRPPVEDGVATGAEPPALVGFANPMTGWPGTPAYHPDHAGETDARDLELFDTLRELLSGRRSAIGQASPAAPAAGTHEVRTDDVQAVLGAIQNKPAPPMMIGGKLVARSVGHLKQDILSQLRQLTPDGKMPRLAEQDSDTVDLVGMLFDQLVKDVKPDSSVQQLMTRLQIPLLRVALKDKSFFTRRAHPARQLLNAVAETGFYWLDDEADDRALVEKMRVVVDRVTHEFDDDLRVFEDLLGDLTKHLGTLARKSEVAERRHVDAAKGREKLDHAREVAQAAIEQRIEKYKPPALIRTLLEQAWTDVLALTVLRQGESSDVYRKRLAIADKLLDTAAAAGDRVPQPESPEAVQLRHEVETGLSQVGYHSDDVQSVVNRLFGAAAAAANDDPATLTELAVKLKSRSRLGEDTSPEPTSKAAAKGKLLSPLSAEEQRVVDRIKTVPFGTWFEFQVNQQGEKVRRKLSWFSPMTGRCLFVNQRGARVEEKTMDSLAREIVRGTARVVEAEKETLIDRAWSAIMSTLKSFAGKPAPKPA